MTEPDESVFSYDGVTADLLLSDEEVRRALHGLDHHLDEAELKEVSRDSIMFCGCSDCIGRVTSGYWVSWTIKMIRQGMIRI